MSYRDYQKGEFCLLDELAKNPKVQIASLLPLPKCIPRNRGITNKDFLLDKFFYMRYTACCMLHTSDTK